MEVAVAPQKHRRSRTLSSVSIPPPGSPTKITIAALTSTSLSAARAAAAGAFTLTGCARAALLGLGPPSNTPHGESLSSYTDSYFPDPYDEYSHTRMAHSYSDKYDDMPASPACSVGSVPSISRTASPFEGERAPIPPGWGVRSARRTRARSPQRERSQEPHSRREPTRIHPVLDTLERGSRLGTGRVFCAGCKKAGSNFPRCTRCAQMWCSRACRTSMVHKCPPRRAQTTY
ncbi:hypothetical protein C8R43DRAFT_408759 [Mycena crocata]|nr:hypothetical protein C8R43DRAFT_408759 [Mycena crocata]